MAGDARETSGTMTSLIVQYVRRVGGPAAVDEVVRRAGVDKTVSELEDESSWSTYEDKVALWKASAEVLRDPIVSRHMGETVLETSVNPVLRTLLRRFGSPRLVLANIARVAPKFATTSVMTASPHGRREM